MAIENTYLLGKNITLGCGFDLQAKAPLDSRQTVPAFAGLQALIDGNAAYEGMIVYDEETKKTYQAQIVDDVLTFREFGINEAELKDLIASETTAAMEFKGAATALPENPTKGDMYKVTASFKVGEEDVKVGDSIVYDGEQWFIIPSGDDIEDTWRPVTGVDNDSTLTFVAGDKLEKTVAADGTITYKHVAIDAPEDMTAEDDEKTRTYITQLITDNHGHIIGFKTATENVEDTNTEYTFEGQSDEATSVYFQVTSSEEGADTEVIYLDAYSKNEADATFKAKRAEKLDAVTTDANVFVDTVAQDVDGNITITTKAVDFSAITNRLDELEKVDHNHDNKELLDTYDQTNADIKDAVEKKHSHSFADSDVEDAISKKHSHTFTDEDVVDAISKEHTHSFSDEAALNGITAAKVADWDDAVSKKHTHNFVDTDVEDAISKKHAHTFVDTDVEDAISKKHSHTFVEAELNKIVDGDVAKWNTAAGKADDNAQAIEDIEGYVGTFTHDTAKTVVEYINAKTDGIATSGNLEALGQRVTALEGASATKDELNAVDAKFEDYTKTADLPTDLGDFTNNAGYAKTADVNTELDKKADKTQVATDMALKADKSVVDAMYTNDQIDGFLAGKVDKETYAEDKATFALKSEISSLTGKADKSYVDEELAKKVNVSDYNNDKATFALKTDFNAYRTSADQDVIDQDFEDRIADLEAIDHDQLAKDASAAAVATVLDGAPEKFNTLKEIAAWIAEADTAEDAASLVTRVSALEAIDHDAYVDADAELKEELEGKINAINNHSHTFVESELNEIKAGDVAKWNAEIGAKALAESKTTTAEVKDQIEAYGYATTGYADGKASAAKDAAIADAAGKYETKGTAQGIVDALKLGETYEPIGAESRAIAAAKTETENQIKVLAGEDNTSTVKKNADDIASLFEQLQWGEF